MRNGNSTEWLTKQKYGICRLSLVSVYQEPRPGSGLITQLLFGETYEVVEVSPDEKWLKIKIGAVNTTGWMQALQHEEISPEDFNFFTGGDNQITTSPVSTLKFREGTIYLLAGSLLQISASELFDTKRFIGFEGRVRNHKEKASRGELIDIARSFRNVPFLSGGRSYFGIGSGSFIQLVFKISGYSVPKFISQLVDAGRPVSAEKAYPGDLVIFGNEKDIPHHAGIYLGDNRVIHVSGKVKEDLIKLNGDAIGKPNSPTHRVLDIRCLI
ncbi:NlpC/P60 family protein [Echinicola jeungdonensis]|uniref:NlpC/P60 family protein n=1 Tax=Echinicola jeungdonensis TaxID=709343 RepID=A0ABV5J7I4_9BACT|nr:NlpC/P60 family protein [Echinicola jeungdonensis]MDN3669739.1 NlpC/P60 family protein [Echinicola jeungdonensis]